MRIEDKKSKAHFVRKEAPALFDKGILGGGADIHDGYVLGLRFKPAPVFHFLGNRNAAPRKGALIPQDLPCAGNIPSRRYGTAVAGGDV